jgi:hypothetical protein
VLRRPIETAPFLGTYPVQAGVGDRFLTGPRSGVGAIDSLNNNISPGSADIPRGPAPPEFFQKT